MAKYATLQELGEYWSIDDLLQAHMVLDMHEQLEDLSAMKAETNSRR